MNKNKFIQNLENILGKERVACDDSALLEYSQDMTENEPGRPNIVIKPTSVEEVRQVVKLANKGKVPIIPVVANTNVGGLAIPYEGGIVMDLRNMNKILEVNERAMYAVIEPGVTFGDMKEYLDENHPDLIFAYSLAPTYASVVCNCLLDGLANLSLRYGTMAEWINGLEVVLPNGDTMRTGSATFHADLKNGWFSRAPLPDLTGLFINWQGTTGIVTKMAVQLWPKPKLRRRFFLLAYDTENTCEIIIRFARSSIFDDLGGIAWTLGKMLFGVEKPIEKDPNEPEFFIYTDVSANTEAEMQAKGGIIDAISDQFVENSVIEEGPIDIPTLLKINPDFEKFAKFPMTLDFLLEHSGRGLTWVGSYGPTAQWSEGISRGCEILKKYGFPPTVVIKPMKGGHFGVLRFITKFNKTDSDEIAKVRQLNEELCDLVLEIGFIPYKTPGWVVKKLTEQIDPNFMRLMRDIKKSIDPNRIMNPGRWLL